jgi:glutathione S-transferase
MAEKGIDDVEIVTLSIMGGEHRSPEYRGKAGLAHVPALELDDGTVITESVAICRYLESVYPEPNLFGRDPKETAIIEMWLRRVEMMVANPVMQGVRHSHPGMAALEAQVPEVARYNLEGAGRSLKILDRQLADSPFIAADRLTIVDVVAVTSLDFGRMIKWRPDPALVHVNRWFDAMLARPAAAAGMTA